VDLFGNHLGDSRNLVSKATGAPSTAMGWDLRTKNTVAYKTPNFSGLTAAVAYVTNTNSGSATDTTTDAWSANGIYKNGPIFAGLAYEKHNLSNAGTGLQDEHAWRLGAGYMFGAAKVVAFYQKASDIGGTSGADRKVWGLGGAFKMGKNTLKAQYYKAGDADNLSNTGASLWALGVDHKMSKRTSVYVAYARTSNDSGASYSAFGGGHGDNPRTVAGKDPSGFSLGMIHKF
jgi:predicted porin